VSLDPLPPHPTLERYYSRDEERRALVREMFDAAAPQYEWVCRVMSFGTGESYRRQALHQAGIRNGMRVLDIATGTGLVLRSAVALVGGGTLAIGLDPSRGMLAECRKNCAAPLIQGRGEQLPFTDSRFDLVSMGYGLRHVADLRALFAEYHRVLRPGGGLLLLEITQPRSSFGRWLNRLYLRTLVPRVVSVGTGGEAARRMMDYFWETVESCVPPSVILDALKGGGFGDAVRRVTGGVLSEYRATKAR
jgi:demethylmenaquinone methyltransferase / 2-methoxy-6-polyprenyl-1,4-benzoquinol methylase